MNATFLKQKTTFSEICQNTKYLTSKIINKIINTFSKTRVDVLMLVQNVSKLLFQLSIRLKLCIRKCLFLNDSDQDHAQIILIRTSVIHTLPETGEFIQYHKLVLHKTIKAAKSISSLAKLQKAVVSDSVMSISIFSFTLKVSLNLMRHSQTKNDGLCRKKDYFTHYKVSILLPGRRNMLVKLICNFESKSARRI